MNKLVIVTGNKGGIGKTFNAVNIKEYLDENGINNVAFDGDNANATFKRYYLNDDSVDTIDIRNNEQFDKVLETAIENDITLLDTRAASYTKFKNWVDEIDLLDLLEEIGVKPVFMFMITKSKDTVAMLKKMYNDFQDNADWIISKNEYQKADVNTSDTFDIYDNSKTRKILVDNGAEEITIPKLKSRLIEILEKNNLTVGKATISNDIKLLDRQRYKKYQKELHNEYDKIKDLLVKGE